MMKDATWFVYMLQCADRTLYTGISTDVDRRLREHNRGAGAKYTRSRLPVDLVYVEEAADRAAALRREHAIRNLTAAAKAELARKQSPGAA